MAHRSPRSPRALVARIVIALTASLALVTAVVPSIFVPAALIPPAYAQPPVDVSSYVTDKSETIPAKQMDAMTRDINSLQSSTGNVLHVTFVDDFDGMSSDSWASVSAQESGFGSRDALLAIAVKTHQYSVYSGGSGFTKSELDSAIDGSVTTPWHEEDWAGGIHKLAQNLRDSLWTASGTGSSNTSSDSDAVGGFVVLVLIGGAIWYFVRKKKRAKAGTPQKTADGKTINLHDLHQKAAESLVQADDGVRAAAGELQFARAEFGVQATQQFQTAVTQAQDLVAQAFEYQKKLDDNIPDTDAEKYHYNSEIVRLTQQAQQTIETQESKFQHLRNLAAKVDTRLQELSQRSSEIRASLPTLQAQITALSASYPQASLSTLATYPRQISVLLDATNTSIQQGQVAVASDDNNGAVPYARMAEDTLQQAAGLADDVANAPQKLAHSAQLLKQGIASLSADVADADRLAPTDPVIQQKKAEAQAALTYAMADDSDPIKALTQLDHAEAAIDAALTGVRSTDEARRKAQQVTDRARAAAEAALDAANQMIDRYARYISRSTRTALAAAQRTYSHAMATTDPTAQASAFAQAQTQAQQALDRAQTDIDSSRSTAGSRGSGTDWGSMLGGMIIGSLLSGGGHRGGFSTGSFGGFGGAGFGGGGFGGSPSGESSGGGGFGGSF
ncbi:MAG: TPM domain-containing protein [Actinomycetaceae bacterium]|nr:TPM domain-containing protein [Actinomycetaceae bacterium]MDY6082714.1 TPM domain-containing protein [Actinomycetaceae bacterium]